MAKSMKAPSMKASIKGGASPAEDQCFDWPVSIPEGVARKRVPVKLPIDMRAVRARERQKREAAEKAAAGRRGGRGDYQMVVMKGGQPWMGAVSQTPKVAVWIVTGVFAGLLMFSIGLFMYFMMSED